MRKFLSLLTIIGLTLGSFPIPAQAATMTIRQELNITTGYMYAASGASATSSAGVIFNANNYSGATYYFEVVASTTAATNAVIHLKNATSTASITSVTVNGTGYARYRSTAFTGPTATTTYVVALGDEAVGKGIIASRIVVLQSADPIQRTQTQIEIGSEVLATTSLATMPASNPKYWKYDSSVWSPTPTFYVDVSYKTGTQIASSTTYTTTGTFTYVVSSTTSYTDVAAWGGGGAGFDGSNTGGGAGGGGGAFASSTLALPRGNSYSMTVGTGGTGSGQAGADSTFNTSTVVADGGTGGSSATTGIGTGGTVANSTGVTRYAGGDGGQGNGGDDGGGGGGGSAGPHGAGGTGANASATAGGGGGGGNGGNNGSGTTGGSSTNGGAGGNGGNGGVCQAGTSNANGGGGSGGADQAGTACTAGAPGGGGGGAETTGPWNGARGQIKITEFIGGVGIAIEEDDGSFGNWTFKHQVVAFGAATSSATTTRSTAFTPTTGRHYRLVASTTNSAVPYSIYNAKIVADSIAQTSSETFTTPVSENTYTFDASDAGPTGSWTNASNAFDSSSSSFAESSLPSVSYLRGTGTNAPTSGGTIHEVKFRYYYDIEGTNTSSTSVMYSTERLGTISGQTSLTPTYTSYITLTTPSGGWTWQKINDLEVNFQADASIVGSVKIYIAEVLVYSTSSWTVPTGPSEFTVEVWGGGGGGGSGGGGFDGGNGATSSVSYNGGASLIEAGGGKGALFGVSAGTGGVAIGGDTNTNGSNGNASGGGGAGGNGGSGGTGGTGNTLGTGGTFPGGGGGGTAWSGTAYGGGGGAYASKVISAATMGATVDILVGGGGGAPHHGSQYGYGGGGRGSGGTAGTDADSVNGGDGGGGSTTCGSGGTGATGSVGGGTNPGAVITVTGPAGGGGSGGGYGGNGGAGGAGANTCYSGSGGGGGGGGNGGNGGQGTGTFGASGSGGGAGGKVTISYNSAITKLELQYLLAPTTLFSGTNAQSYLTYWDSTEWNTTNAYIHQVNARDNSTSVITLIDSGGTLVTNSTVTSPDNRGVSASMCMPSTGNIDVKATTNNGDIYDSRILVQVGGTAASCGGGGGDSGPAPKFFFINAEVKLTDDNVFFTN